MAPCDEGLLLGDAARAIGVSPDTLRRWERAGKLRTKRDSANRRRVSPPRGRAARRATRAPPRRRRAVRAQPLPRRRPLGRGRRRDGARRDRGGPAPGHRRGHARRGRGARARPGVPATAAVKATSVMVERGDGEARWRSRSLARSWCCAGCGDDDDCGEESQPRLVVSAAVLDDGGARDVRARVRRCRGRRRAAQLRRLRRARGPDPPGREAGRLRGREHAASGRAERRGPARRQPVEFATNEFVLAVPADSGHRLDRGPDTSPGVKLAIGSESVPIGSYTREALAKLPPARRRRSSRTCARTSPT